MRLTLRLFLRGAAPARSHSRASSRWRRRSEGGGSGRRRGVPAAAKCLGMQVVFDAAAEVTNLCGRAIPHLSLTELCPWQKHEE